ncbi:MAG: branched-chain amino acid ABC transporter permease [Rhizobiaceae bacterium]
MQRAATLGLLVFLLVLPAFADSAAVKAIMPTGLHGAALLNMFLLIFLFGYLAQSWNILGGFTGQLSLGHSAFFGIGAYISTLMFVNAGISPWIGMLVSMVAAGAFGLLIGFLSFHYRLAGPYFTLATIAFAELVRLTALHLKVTGGSMGVLIPLQGDSFWQFQFSGKIPYYYIALAMMLAVTALVWWIARSRTGFYLHAIRQDENAAEAIGVDTRRFKLLAVTLSAALTGAGGTFYAQYTQYIVPDDILTVGLSVEIILRAIIGGSATVFGPIVGSFILTPVAEATRVLLSGSSSGATVVKLFASQIPFAEKMAGYLKFLSGGGGGGGALMLYGLVLIFTCLAMPNGAVPWFRRMMRR